MAVTVWSDAAVRYVDATRLACGAEVAVAVRREGTLWRLYFKRCDDGGASWPVDNAAVPIAVLERKEPWFIRETGSVLVVANGRDRAFISRESGMAAEHWWPQP